MEKNLNVILKPEKIQFTKNYIRITDSHTGNYRIQYEDIVMAGIRTYDGETGDWYEPEITEITTDMEGDLILCDNQSCQWIIHTDLAGRTAEAMLSDLTMHAPYILIGRQTWFDAEDKSAFAEIGEMVDLMRQC